MGRRVVRSATLDPKRRLRDVGDAILLLEMASEAPPAEPRASGIRSWLPWAAALAPGAAMAQDDVDSLLADLGF